MQHLVSVGIPTYNRPDGLRRTLECVTSQTYTNLEIIVSDNCSTIPEVQTIVESFAKNDSRIVYIRQDVNIGAGKNFTFVLNRASAGYFIWAADDDEWLELDFLEKMMKYAPRNILTFSSAVFNRKDGFHYPLKDYVNCRDKFDYLRVFCSNGLGHPFYGLYNLTLFKEHHLTFQFDEDLLYYNEGTFLHKVFLTGLVKYIDDAHILFSTESAKPSYDLRINNFVEYFKRTLLIYINAKGISEEQRYILINQVLNLYIPHLKNLFRNFALNEKQNASLPNGLSGHAKKDSFVRKVQRRIVRTVKVLISGNY